MLRTMKAKFLFLFLFAFIGISNSYAQENTSFPITGTFLVSKEGTTVADFDKVIIEKSGYSVYKGNTLLRTYKIVSKNSEGFLVEQFFEGNEKKDRPRFTVRLDKVDQNNFFITVFKGNRVEKLNLIKT